MKPIQIALAPTRNRPLNMFLGVVLALVSVLFFCALATYHTSDPSWNTAADPAGPGAIANWVGPFGAFSGDLLLQSIGFTAFFLPLWMGGVAWGWMRSRPGGSAVLRMAGILMSVVFVPALFAMLPWHWRWAHTVPVEGVLGRLVSGMLVAYLNIQGAWIVAAVLATSGLYFASSISFWAVKETMADRWIQMQSWRDRWRNWREERADQRADEEEFEEDENAPGPPQRLFTGALGAEEAEEPVAQRPPSRLAALFGRKNRATEADPVDQPAIQRAASAKSGEQQHLGPDARNRNTCPGACFDPSLRNGTSTPGTKTCPRGPRTWGTRTRDDNNSGATHSGPGPAHGNKAHGCRGSLRRDARRRERSLPGLRSETWGTRPE